MAINPSNVYAQLSDLQDILSANGVALRLDDVPPDTLANAINKAGNKVDFYLGRVYSPDQLVQSSLVVDWAAALACHFLCARRNNPVGVGCKTLYDDAIADMIEVKKGRSDIPGIPRRKGFVPTLSIKQVVQRPFNRGVIEVSRGSQVSKAANITQEKSLYDEIGLNNPAILEYDQ
jgi:hypothetical protein